MSKTIKLVNSDKTATVDDCCFAYINQFTWHLMADGRAGRLEPCEDDPKSPHLIYLDEEVAGRHICDVEQNVKQTNGCYECRAGIGEPHKAGCELAICLVTGEQRLTCTSVHDCGADVWRGAMAGEAECIEFGWFSKWVDDQGETIPVDAWKTVKGHWVDTTADDPDAVPDFSRLETDARWDSKAGRWVLR